MEGTFIPFPASIIWRVHIIWPIANVGEKFKRKFRVSLFISLAKSVTFTTSEKVSLNGNQNKSVLNDYLPFTSWLFGNWREFRLTQNWTISVSLQGLRGLKQRRETRGKWKGTWYRGRTRTWVASGNSLCSLSSDPVLATEFWDFSDVPIRPVPSSHSEGTAEDSLIRPLMGLRGYPDESQSSSGCVPRMEEFSFSGFHRHRRKGATDPSVIHRGI